MREYEVTVIFQPKLEEEPRTELIEQVSGWLTHSEEETDKPVANHWGERRLAYPIEENTTGYYVLYEAKLNPDRIVDIEKSFKFQEDVLRYLIVRKED